jgi:hypothetical protein
MTGYGRGATRAASIYGLGVAALLPFSIISLAITTRYLDLADYGRLAALFALAGVLTLIAGLGIVQGTIMVVYRSGDDGADGADAIDDGGGDADDMDAILGGDDHRSIDEKRRILGSGLLLVSGAAATIAGIVAVCAPLVADVLLGSSGWAGSVRWMALSVWMGAIWRMAHQVWRLERRQWEWLGFQVLRPLLAVIGTLITLMAGMGVDGPLAATAGATFIAIVASMTGSWRCWLFRWAPHDYLQIWRVGRKFISMQLAGLAQSHLAILLLAVTSSSSAVGIYAVAQRIANIPSYFADGFFMAWPTIDSSPIGMAARLRRGRARHAAGVFSLLCLTTLGLLVLVSLSANGALHVLAPGFGAAADLIPLIAAGTLGHVVFRGIYRAARFPARRAWYVGLHFVWIAPFVGVAAVLLPIGPTWAIAGANVVAYAIIAYGMAWRDRKSVAPTPFAWRRLGIAVLGAAICIVGLEESQTSGAVRAAVSVVILVIFPVVLVAVGVIPRSQVRMIFEILSVLLPARRRRSTFTAVAELPQAQRETVVRLLWDQQSVAAVASQAQVSDQVVRARLVRGLRGVSGIGEPSERDAVIGEYLLSTSLMTLERDEIARRMARSGIDPLVLDQLEQSMNDVRRLRRYGSKRVDAALVQA